MTTKPADALSAVDEGLRRYIENEILPRYNGFDKAHGTDHAMQVIGQSMEIARNYDVDAAMVYTVAAYHDTGLCEGRERHHTVSAEILKSDEFLRSRFDDGQIATMCEAVEDHRASAEREPRSIYGRIVAEADRCLDTETVIRRTIRYGIDHNPDFDRKQHFERCMAHLSKKYGEGGYLKLWIPESENGRKLAVLRDLLRKPAELERIFDAIYDEEVG